MGCRRVWLRKHLHFSAKDGLLTYTLADAFAHALALTDSDPDAERERHDLWLAHAVWNAQRYDDA